MLKPTRAFPENSPVTEGPNGKMMPKYVYGTPLMMDISDLIESHFGQKVKEYDFKKVKEAIKRFNDFWKTKLSNRIVFETFEKELNELDVDDVYEFTDVKEFEKIWNRHTL